MTHKNSIAIKKQRAMEYYQSMNPEAFLPIFMNDYEMANKTNGLSVVSCDLDFNECIEIRKNGKASYVFPTDVFIRILNAHSVFGCIFFPTMYDKGIDYPTQETLKMAIGYRFYEFNICDEQFLTYMEKFPDDSQVFIFRGLNVQTCSEFDKGDPYAKRAYVSGACVMYIPIIQMAFIKMNDYRVS
jgi:hypothetical protein